MAVTGTEPISAANLKAVLDAMPDQIDSASIIATRASGSGTKHISVSGGSGSGNVGLSMTGGGVTASSGIVAVPVYGLYYVSCTANIELSGAANRGPEAAVTLFTPSGSVEFAHESVSSTFGMSGTGSSSGFYSYSTVEPMNAGGQIRLFAELWGDTVDSGRKADFTCTMTVQRLL